jgi:hypothetical protein
MRDSDFFSGIAHGKIPWGDRQMSVPVFYYDITGLSVLMLASLDKLKAILPSKRMHPYRVTPWHGIFVITAYEYRDTDIEPYNEVILGVPLLMDKSSPLFMGVLRKAPEITMMYIHHIPVNTQIALESGVEFASFPKILAEIDFKSSADWLTCQMNADGKHILTIKGRKLKLEQFPRQHLHPITVSQSRMLRLEFNLSECQAGLSNNQSDVSLELGDHPMAQELRDLRLGRILQYQYCQQLQAVLSPVCESYPL